MMPWFALLTIFRVLSISLVIVALPLLWIPIYASLLLVIICVGYYRTKRKGDFITRGLKSAFTSGFSSILIILIKFCCLFSWWPISSWKDLPKLLVCCQPLSSGTLKLQSFHELSTVGTPELRHCHSEQNCFYNCLHQLRDNIVCCVPCSARHV